MTKNEFTKKYCGVQNLAKCKQVTWDLCSDIEDTFSDGNLTDEIALGAAHYSIEILLEVMRADLPDFGYLSDMKADIERMAEDLAASAMHGDGEGGEA